MIKILFLNRIGYPILLILCQYFNPAFILICYEINDYHVNTVSKILPKEPGTIFSLEEKVIQNIFVSKIE